MNRQLQMTRNYSAVSGACLLMRREVFQQIGGFDEKLSGALADVDLCLKMRGAGYLIVYTPMAKLCLDPSPPRKTRRQRRSDHAPALVRRCWNVILTTIQISQERADFSLGR